MPEWIRRSGKGAVNALFSVVFRCADVFNTSVAEKLKHQWGLKKSGNISTNGGRGE
jgi:hypothetical protein